MADGEYHHEEVHEEVHNSVGTPVPGETYVEQQERSENRKRMLMKILKWILIVILVVFLIWLLWLGGRSTWRYFHRPAQVSGKPPIQEIQEYLAKAKDNITSAEERDLGFALIKDARDRDKNIQVTEENLKTVGVNIVGKCPDKSAHRIKRIQRASKVAVKDDLGAFYHKVSDKSCGPPFCP